MREERRGGVITTKCSGLRREAAGWVEIGSGLSSRGWGVDDEKNMWGLVWIGKIGFSWATKLS